MRRRPSERFDPARCFLVRDSARGLVRIGTSGLAALGAAWLPPCKSWVFVGGDGVVVWGRFIPYAAIKGVREEWRYQAEGFDGQMSAWGEAMEILEVIERNTCKMPEP
jgi:hypothetical protein